MRDHFILEARDATIIVGVLAVCSVFQAQLASMRLASSMSPMHQTCFFTCFACTSLHNHNPSGVLAVILGNQSVPTACIHAVGTEWVTPGLLRVAIAVCGFHETSQFHESHAPDMFYFTCFAWSSLHNHNPSSVLAVCFYWLP